MNNERRRSVGLRQATLAHHAAAASVLLLFGPGCAEQLGEDEPVASVAAASVAAEGLVSAPLYEWRAVARDGAATVQAEAGSLALAYPDGTRHVLGIDAFETADGLPVAVTYEESQDSPEQAIALRLSADLVATRPLDGHRPAADDAGLREAPPVLPLRDRLDTWLNSMPVGETVEVIVGLRSEPDFNPFQESQRRQVVDGLTAEESRTLRVALIAEYRSHVLLLQEPVVDWIHERGASVLERYWAGSGLLVRASAPVLYELAEHPEVWTIERTSVVQDETVDGWQLNLGMQNQYYLAYQYDGERANPARHSYGDITLAILDSTFEDDIYAFRDGAGSATRVHGMWDCELDPPCTVVGDMSPGISSHGTSVAAVAAGDLTDGQDPRIPDPAQRRRGSFVSQEAGLVLVSRGSFGGTPAIQRQIDLACSLATDGVNLSAGADEDYDCDGASYMSSSVDYLVRYCGAFFAKSAGNDGHADPDECTVTPPGGATYAFAVGGTLNSIDGDYNTVRTGPIFENSSRGGQPYLYGTRTIINTVAPAYLDQVPMSDGWYGSPGAGTSFAAPAVLGAFANFRDHWLSTGTVPSFVNDPHNSYVTLLLMTDRQGESGVRVAGFDELWGGGRFRQRLFTEYGMDAPWGRLTSVAGVYDGGVTTIPINKGLPLPAAADRLTVAMWWPEKNQAPGTGGADITLAVYTTCGPWQAYADVSYDNKKRVFRSGNVGGSCWAVDLNGFSVPASTWEQNTTRRTVRVAAYWEDEARDDPDGPAPDIQ